MFNMVSSDRNIFVTKCNILTIEIMTKLNIV